MLPVLPKFYLFSRINRCTSKGQTLVEITIALAIGILLIVGFVSAMNIGLSSTTYASEKLRAVQYAQEGLEKLRNYRDEQGWTHFSDSVLDCNASPCEELEFFNNCEENFQNCGSGSRYSYDSTVPAPFERTYEAISTTPPLIRVSISWPTRTGPAIVELYTVLTDWKYDPN